MDTLFYEYWFIWFDKLSILILKITGQDFWLSVWLLLNTKLILAIHFFVVNLNKNHQQLKWDNKVVV